MSSRQRVWVDILRSVLPSSPFRTLSKLANDLFLFFGKVAHVVGKRSSFKDESKIPHLVRGLILMKRGRAV